MKTINLDVEIKSTGLILGHHVINNVIGLDLEKKTLALSILSFLNKEAFDSKKMAVKISKTVIQLEDFKNLEKSVLDFLNKQNLETVLNFVEKPFQR